MTSIKLALCGLGVAGKARLQSSSHFEIAGIISRRPEVASLNWSEFLDRDDVSAVAISTENTQHTRLVRESLQADKHVLCDYPLAFSQSEAQELFDLAEQKNLILHVEHIGLLTQAHQQAKSEILGLGKLLQGEYSFTGGWNEKLCDENYTGPHWILALSRLLQIADWLGEFNLSVENYISNENELLIEAKLELSDQGVILFKEHRQSGLKRQRTFKAKFEQGHFDWPKTKELGGLFEQDLNWFYDRIVSGKENYYDENLMLSCLRELEKFQHHFK